MASIAESFGFSGDESGAAFRTSRAWRALRRTPRRRRVWSAPARSRACSAFRRTLPRTPARNRRKVLPSIRGSASLLVRTQWCSSMSQTSPSALCSAGPPLSNSCALTPLVSEQRRGSSAWVTMAAEPPMWLATCTTQSQLRSSIVIRVSSAARGRREERVSTVTSSTSPAVATEDEILSDLSRRSPQHHISRGDTMSPAVRCFLYLSTFVVGCAAPDDSSDAVGASSAVSTSSSGARDCRAYVSNDRTWCDSSDCRAYLKNDPRLCDSRDCRAYLKNDPQWCDGDGAGPPVPVLARIRSSASRGDEADL